MNLLGLLHAAWASDATLQSLLPVSKLSTGSQANPEPPYAEVSEIARTGNGKTNKSHYDDLEVQFMIVSSSYSSGRAIRDRVLEYFRDDTFTLDSGRVLNLGFLSDNYLEDTTDPTETFHRFQVSFQAKISTPRT